MLWLFLDREGELKTARCRNKKVTNDRTIPRLLFCEFPFKTEDRLTRLPRWPKQIFFSVCIC